MNKMRRQELMALAHEVEKVQETDDVYEVINTLENIKYDEEYYYDNIPENLQYSQRAYDSEAAIDNMEQALHALNDILDLKTNKTMQDLLNTAIEYINEARY